MKFALALLCVIVMMGCESGMTTYPGETITILGKLKLISLNGDTVQPPYDKVTVNLYQYDDTSKGFTETAFSNGFWAFRGVPARHYAAEATKQGYGRSGLLDIQSQTSDTLHLTLAEQPRVQPVLDSIEIDTSGVDEELRLYIRMTPEANEKLSAIILPYLDDTIFRIIPLETPTVTENSGHFQMTFKAESLLLETSIGQAAMVGVVAYNPAVGVYPFAKDLAGHRYYRYKSEGPLSNFLPVPK